MRVLVTGGAGFIGSHIVEQLADAGAEVRILDREVGGEAVVDRRADVVVGDVADPTVVGGAVDGIDVVCHQAARVGLGVDFTDAPDYVRDNDVGTVVLLRALHQSGFRGRLVLASSMVVYGEGRYRCRSHGRVMARPRGEEDLQAGRFEPRCPACGGEVSLELVGEDDPPDPRNVYAATKLHQEHLCSVFGRETGNPVISLRYHNVYGTRMPRDTPYAGVASIFMSALAAGRPPQVFEDGGQRRDFVHVRDVARANVHALEADIGVVGAFNIASGEPHTVGELASALAQAFGPVAPEPVATGQYRLGDVRHIVASPEKARGALGYDPLVSFDAGVAELAAERVGATT